MTGAAASRAAAADDARPVLRVLRGGGDGDLAVELAALVTVLASRPSAVPDEIPAPVGGWADRSRSVRRPASPGPGAWRASGLPG